MDIEWEGVSCLPPVCDTVAKPHQVQRESTIVQVDMGQDPRQHIIANAQTSTALEVGTHQTPHLKE